MKKVIFKITVVILLICSSKTIFAQQGGKFYGTVPARTNLIIRNGDQIFPLYWGCTPSNPYYVVTSGVAPNESQTIVFTWISSHFFRGVPLDANAIIVTYFDSGKYGTLSKGDSIQIIKWKK